MIQRCRGAALGLLIFTAVLPGWAASPHLRPEQGGEIPWSTRSDGWMVWYEDETFEDCGPIMNEKVQAMDSELAKAERESERCLDVWQPALPYFVATAEACQALQARFTRSPEGLVAEEFKCSRERPAPQNDD